MAQARQESGRQQEGVVFPLDAEGRRSSVATGRSVWADAVRGQDPELARRTESGGDWRKDYVAAVVAHTAAATRTAAGALEVARAGLASLGARMAFARGGTTVPLGQALAAAQDGALGTEVVRGGGERERGLAVPFRGQVLRGDALRRQVDAWRERGSMEDSCAAALHRLVDEPDRLDVSDRAFALLGAGAEMGPLEPLLRWGAHVVAVDRPDDRVWDRMRGTAAGAAGTLTLPHDGDRPGVDLLTRTPEVAAFLRTAAPGRPLTVGSYAYADGARHVQLVHAGDGVVELLLRERPGTGYAELATPTDAFAVPEEVVADSRRRYGARGAWGPLQSPARALAAVYVPAYRTVVQRDDGASAGVADVLVPQQGPSYTLAKRVQRWRAVAAQADGHPVSANVAPATQTRSVLSNRVLAAAYAGAGRFGVEVFAPETSRVLMAALLVSDVRDPVVPAHPDDLFVHGAAHGGLWRIAYEPRSVLGLAAVLGLPAALRPRPSRTPR